MIIIKSGVGIGAIVYGVNVQKIPETNTVVNLGGQMLIRGRYALTRRGKGTRPEGTGGDTTKYPFFQMEYMEDLPDGEKTLESVPLNL